MKVTENAFAEKPAIEWLQHAGWSLRRGTSLIPGLSRDRKILSDVVLQQTFRAAVAALNPELPTKAVAHAVDRALAATSPIAILSHQAFHETLLAGVQVSWLDRPAASSPPEPSSSTGNDPRATSSRSSTS